MFFIIPKSKFLKLKKSLTLSTGGSTLNLGFTNIMHTFTQRAWKIVLLHPLGSRTFIDQSSKASRLFQLAKQAVKQNDPF